MKDLSEAQRNFKLDIEAMTDKIKRENLKRERNKIINTLHKEIEEGRKGKSEYKDRRNREE